MTSVSREKKRRRNHFNLRDSIYEPEYKNVKRPIHPRTKDPIEPAHRFEITLEPDEFTNEKFAPLNTLLKKAWS
jgi:arginine-tRNA-protein transferase